VSPTDHDWIGPGDPFPLGVASFDPLPEGVLLWTAVAGGGPCRWEISADRAFRQVVAAGEVEADPATGIVTVDVTGLRPGTGYWYRFEAAGALSPLGRTRTLPAGSEDHLRIGATCCARYGEQPFAVYRELARTDVDLVVHLGDYVYEDAKCAIPERAPDPDHDCVTLDDYRRRHAQARRDPDLQALHSRHPMIVVWDDHDLADNAWAGGAKTHDEETQGPWADRRAAALQAHNEYLPKRLADPADPATAWRHLDAGSFVRIAATETRAHRDEQAGIDGALPADDPRRTMLGPAQEAWADEALGDGTPRWLVVLSGTVVSELTLPAPELLDGVMPEKYAVVDGSATNTDQWDGYLAARARLARTLGQRAGRTVVLSGDIHSAWAIEGPRDDDGRPVAVELVVPPAATTPIGQLAPTDAVARATEAIGQQVDGVRWVDVAHHGFLVLSLTHHEAVATWWWVDPEGAASTEIGRRWVVPGEGPVRLVDPEPAPSADRADPDGDGDGRRRRRWPRRLLALGGAAAAVAGARRLRRQS